MKQIANLGDRRQTDFCAYCGSKTQSMDHVPSKILLDDPLPSNVHVVPACLACNQGFSADEEYFACLMDCLVTGATNPDGMSREKIKRVLSSKPNMVSRLENARQVDGDRISFRIEEKRVRNVVLKLARGHALYELNEPQFTEPFILAYSPLSSLSDDVRSRFEEVIETQLLPEVGSRAMQRLFTGGGRDAFRMDKRSTWTLPLPCLYWWRSCNTNSSRRIFSLRSDLGIVRGTINQ